eukprot:GHVS01080278.1.p1 GENE.GHVS01080278.1~~GHVS01080278.1.p1  ORF type:complete len:199 (+),score=49.36 GHVS01080278.1:366-962(+)
MQGGRGGRGGWGGRGSPYDREGIELKGPVTSEPLTYPPNKRLPLAPTLGNLEKKLVILNRTLTNYFNNSECFMAPRASLTGTQLFSDVPNTTNIAAQKKRIVAHVDAQFFPPELMQDHLITPEKRQQMLTSDKKKLSLKEMEKREREGGKEAGQQNEEAEDELKPEEEEDFGGDDYAHDHYADEDMDDHLDSADVGVD